MGTTHVHNISEASAPKSPSWHSILCHLAVWSWVKYLSSLSSGVFLRKLWAVPAPQNKTKWKNYEKQPTHGTSWVFKNGSCCVFVEWAICWVFSLWGRYVKMESVSETGRTSAPWGWISHPQESKGNKPEPERIHGQLYDLVSMLAIQALLSQAAR